MNNHKQQWSRTQSEHPHSNQSKHRKWTKNDKNIIIWIPNGKQLTIGTGSVAKNKVYASWVDTCMDTKYISCTEHQNRILDKLFDIFFHHVFALIPETWDDCFCSFFSSRWISTWIIQFLCNSCCFHSLKICSYKYFPLFGNEVHWGRYDDFSLKPKHSTSGKWYAKKCAF